MLLYVEEPAPGREAPLRGLIGRIEDEVGSAYRTFSTAEELRTLVTDDLALLLTERFHTGAEVSDEPSGLPARTTSFVGRDRELEELLNLVERVEVRLVTLTGPGGIGKTRLAVETARRLAPRFPERRSVWVYWITGSYLEGRKLVAELLASPSSLSDAGRARVVAVDGVLAALLGDLATAQAELGEALEWYRANDDEGRATALVGLGIATAPSDPDRARTLMLERARLFAAIGDPCGEAIVLGSLGWLDTGQGDFTEESLFERAYDLARYTDDEVATAHTATNLAELHIAVVRRGAPGAGRRAVGP